MLFEPCLFSKQLLFTGKWFLYGKLLMEWRCKQKDRKICKQLLWCHINALNYCAHTTQTMQISKETKK
ncbi:hypothetical protein C7N43_37185 [Sphingobacteriales bacterium UPWRP_1]|nr:hypothetical protein C7N43_37185 [Sphingobacteriales bacterium UPWRP_1]